MTSTGAYESQLALVALDPATRSSAASVNGATINRNQAGQGIMRTVTFVVQAGTITDGTHTFKVQDSTDGGSNWNDNSTDLLGSPPAIGSTDDSKTWVFAYTGSAQHVRVVATTAGATSGGVFGAVALLGGGRRIPVR